MAITYHAGRRIQGLERTGSTPSTEEVNFGSGYTYNSSYFSATGSNGYTFTENASSIDQVMWKDLTTSVVGTQYVMRFPFTLTSFTGHTTNYNNHKQEIGLGASYGTGEDPSHDFVGLRYTQNQTTDKIDFQILARDGGTKTYSAAYSVAYSSISTPTTWYMEVIKDGDSYKLKVYEDEYVTQLGSTATVTQTGITGLRYFNHNIYTQSSNGVSNGSSTGYDIYDGITSVVATAGDVKPTNVQVGSRWEETDTRKMYHYNDTLSVTQDFDSNTGHTVNQTTVNGWYAEIYNKIAYDGTNNRLSFTCHDPTNWGASFDLQQSANGGFGSAISNTKWVLRFKWYILTNSGSTSNGAQGALGISSVPATTISSMDFMGLSLRQHASSGEVGLFNATIDNTNPMNQGQSAKKFVTGNLSTSTAYFVEIIRNGDVCTTTLRTGSHTGTSVGTLDRTVTNISGLRYLYFKAQQDSATATHTSYVDDIKFYNGVTATGNAWSEEGT